MTDRSAKLVAVALAGAASPAALAGPAALTDVALDEVTAGAPATPTAVGERPAAVVADGASYAFDAQTRIELADRVQEAGRALNAVNAAGSDVINGVNVLSGDVADARRALQGNSFEQRNLQAGAVREASLQGVALTESRLTSDSFTSGSSIASTTEFRLVSRSRNTTIDQFAVHVPEYNPLQNLTLTMGTPALAPLTIPRFSFDLIEEVGDAKFGIAAGVGPVTIGAPQLVLGSVSLDGDDVLLSSGYVQLPSLDLGSVDGQICFVGCAGGSIDLGGFAGGRVDLPGGDLRFEGANPFKDVQINAGHGIAAVGAGSISVTPGRVTLDASLELDLPDPSFSFDFTIPGIGFGDLGSIGPWTIDGPDVAIEIPAVGFRHTLIDEDVGFAYSATFDGVLCLAFQATDCGSGSRRVERELWRIEQEISAYAASARSSATAFASGEIAVHAGATLTGAEAELIVMSQASARIDAESGIALGDSAQRGMRALNAVNATGAIIGNALNVTTLQPGVGMPAPASGAIGQTNTFVQYRTRYGQ
jgi:hypothetical protein